MDLESRLSEAEKEVRTGGGKLSCTLAITKHDIPCIITWSMMAFMII